MAKTKTTPEQQLIKEVKILSKEVSALSKEVTKLKHLEFIKIFKKPMKFIWFSLLKGLMVGFGTVLGATVLVALFVYIISKISFVPIIGDFVEKVIREVSPKTQVEDQVDPEPAPNTEGVNRESIAL